VRKERSLFVGMPSDQYTDVIIPLCAYDESRFLSYYKLKGSHTSVDWRYLSESYIRSYSGNSNSRIFLYVGRPEPFTSDIFLEGFDTIKSFLSSFEISDNNLKKELLKTFL
jgi:hypothetical protein